LALSALNSAARTKPHLIRDHLTSILPGLYKETVVKPELIRTVQMGPWTQKFDDGLEARKTAYETMYTLVRYMALIILLQYLINALDSSTHA
jgi:cullin-associated NEDD8-dissociated protein 1